MIHDLEIKLWNLDTSESSDITDVCLSRSAKVLHNWTRTFTVEVPAGHASITTAFADGDPAARRGNRKLIVKRDGSVIHHGRLFNIERAGDGTRNRATITSFDPLMELGYESDDRAGRPVRDATGNFISPVFNAGAPIAPGDLIQQILTNSIQTGDESDPTPGEGPLPIDLDEGTFDLTGTDVNPRDNMQWPMMVGDFIQSIVDTGQADIYLRPVDPAEGLDPYFMVSLSVVNLFGTDKSGTVHFDYWTGSKNAKTARHVEDFAPINNKLYDYLGPRLTQNRWKGNITPGTAGTTVDPTASRDKYGVFMQIREFDSVGRENDPAIRPLYIAGWNAEQGYRVEPRDMLFLTPNPDAKAVFEPYDDYNVGDLVAVNVGGDFGVNIAAVQRVYGWSVEWDREGVERVSELLVSADPA